MSIKWGLLINIIVLQDIKYHLTLEVLFILQLLSANITTSSLNLISCLYDRARQVHVASDAFVDEARRSQGNHGYQTRAAMEETSRQSAEAADEDDSTSEVGTPALLVPAAATGAAAGCYLTVWRLL